MNTYKDKKQSGTDEKPLKKASSWKKDTVFISVAARPIRVANTWYCWRCLASVSVQHRSKRRS
jgi:hypothetical protein